MSGEIDELLTKEWKDKIVSGENFLDKDFKSISTSSLKLDFALGRPFLEGSIVEVFGDNSVGKSTLALEVSSNAMLMGKRVFYIDLERKLREAQIKMIKNFNRELFTVIYPDTGEETINMMYKCITEFPGSVLVLDSVSGLLPEVEEAEDASKQTMGVVARLCHKMIRKVTGPAARNKCLLIFLNHKTASMQMYGPSDTVHGGKAIVNRSAQRIEMTRNMSGLIKDKGEDGEVIGQMVRCRVIKNNLNRPFISCEIPIIYGKGIDSDLDLFQLACEIGVLNTESKGWYESSVEGYTGKKRQSDVLELIQTDATFKAGLVAQVTAVMTAE
jgi:recombination protein RecA